MEQFDLKKFLVENKLTNNSKTKASKKKNRISEGSLNEQENTWPEDIWGKGNLPPHPDQRKWDEILAFMAQQHGASYATKNEKTLINTIAGIAKGTTRVGIYGAWKDWQKTQNK